MEANTKATSKITICMDKEHTLLEKEANVNSTRALSNLMKDMASEY